ncbi:MAG: hypothetical protein ABFD60_13585, partial [Bryobacteraceae bacterium]
TSNRLTQDPWYSVTGSHCVFQLQKARIWALFEAGNVQRRDGLITAVQLTSLTAAATIVRFEGLN